MELENLSINCECEGKYNAPENAEEDRELALVEHVELVDNVETLQVADSIATRGALGNNLHGELMLRGKGRAD